MIEFDTDEEFELAAAQSGDEIEKDGKKVQLVVIREKSEPPKEEKKEDRNEKLLKLMSVQMSVAEKTIESQSRQIDHAISLQDIIRELASKDPKKPSSFQFKVTERDKKGQMSEATMQVIY